MHPKIIRLYTHVCTTKHLRKRNNILFGQQNLKAKRGGKMKGTRMVGGRVDAKEVQTFRLLESQRYYINIRKAFEWIT